MIAYIKGRIAEILEDGCGIDHRDAHRNRIRGSFKTCCCKSKVRKDKTMIAYIKGRIAEILEDRVILEAGAMGYNIFMPMASAEAVLRKGDEVKLHTYLNVREDAMQLFGFLTRDDLNTFKLLLGVNGIGPKAALGVLSGLTADELRFAVLADDVKTISRAPGIGKKTAQKLILELKDKMDLQEAFIFMPMASAEAVLRKGDEVKLHTYLNVREDAMQLFGFLTRDDLNTFKLLLGVNGIGPKAALGVLSGLTADELRFAVLADDVKTISRAPGIGKKTAQKLILELKDKMDLQEAFELKTEHVREAQGNGSELSDARKEAVEALTALGYSGADALRAVKKVDMTPEMDVETLLKAALKNLF